MSLLPWLPWQSIWQRAAILPAIQELPLLLPLLFAITLRELRGTLHRDDDDDDGDVADDESVS